MKAHPPFHTLLQWAPPPRCILPPCRHRSLHFHTMLTSVQPLSVCFNANPRVSPWCRRLQPICGFWTRNTSQPSLATSWCWTRSSHPILGNATRRVLCHCEQPHCGKTLNHIGNQVSGLKVKQLGVSGSSLTIGVQGVAAAVFGVE